MPSRSKRAPVRKKTVVPDPVPRLARRLACHQALYDPLREPRNGARWLKPLQSWQAQRLEASFAGFLADPARRPAARFFLTDLYGDHDFSRRDADIARVIPMMQKLLPAALLKTVADGIELAALTHALDLRMAAALDRLAPRRHGLEAGLYARAYRAVGHPRLRARQIALIDDVGEGLWAALRMHGVGTLLKVSRLPARAMGFGELQGFLERGFDAFGRLGDAKPFLADIRASETRVMQRLFAGDANPFGGT
jgi:hypothetical protein